MSWSAAGARAMWAQHFDSTLVCPLLCSVTSTPVLRFSSSSARLKYPTPPQQAMYLEYSGYRESKAVRGCGGRDKTRQHAPRGTDRM